MYEDATIYFYNLTICQTLHLEYLPKWGPILPTSINVNLVETYKADVQQNTAWVPTDRAGWRDLQGQWGNTFRIPV